MAQMTTDNKYLDHFAIMGLKNRREDPFFQSLEVNAIEVGH